MINSFSFKFETQGKLSKLIQNPIPIKILKKNCEICSYITPQLQ